jgi:uncharacterized RDD family membrane protein YckC
VTPPAERDTRDVVTPYAFQVDPALIGLPLARPWQRLVALSADGILVALLSLVPDAALAIAAGAALWRALHTTESPRVLARRGWLRALALALVAGGAAGLWLTFPSRTMPVVHPPESGSTRFTVELGSPTDGIVGLARRALDELGIGLGWAALYFTVFPAWWNGQTPGKRLLNLRVVQLDATPITPWEAFERYGGYGAGLATGLLGFAQVWWDPNRQAIHDKIAETVVIRGGLPPGDREQILPAAGGEATRSSPPSSR